MGYSFISLINSLYYYSFKRIEKYLFRDTTKMILKALVFPEAGRKRELES